jgi:hypothetical protein
MLAPNASAGYWLGCVMRMGPRGTDFDVRYYELYDGYDDEYYFDREGEISSCAVGSILGTVDLDALSGNNRFTVSSEEHDALTELAEQSRQTLVEERAAERRRASNFRRADDEQREEEGRTWRSTSSRRRRGLSGE